MLKKLKKLKVIPGYKGCIIHKNHRVYKNHTSHKNCMDYEDQRGHKDLKEIIKKIIS